LPSRQFKSNNHEQFEPERHVFSPPYLFIFVAILKQALRSGGRDASVGKT
jgi:hypothetical protein